MSDNWYREDDSCIWWLDNGDEAIGEFIFSFDKKTKFYLFGDYPEKLSPEQKKIFDENEPYWRDFFGA